MQAVEVAMPGGYEERGRWCRTVRLRPWCGQDEAVLLEDLADAPPAVRTTALLARCLAPNGLTHGADPTLARTLSLGDREALLLHLRRITLGNRLSCVLTCSACRSPLDLELRAADLLLPPYAHEGLEHEAVVGTPTGPVRLRFRLPNGGDQEAAAHVFRQEGEEAAVRLVLDRCVRSVSLEEGKPLEALPPEASHRLAQILAERDPQAEIQLDAVCPACGHAFVAPLDFGQYLQEEMARGADSLYREVHALASHYHWGEDAILSMTGRKRRRYLGLIAEALHPGAAP